MAVLLGVFELSEMILLGGKIRMESGTDGGMSDGLSQIVCGLFKSAGAGGDQGQSMKSPRAPRLLR
jgi:hypothetical protein